MTILNATLAFAWGSRSISKTFLSWTIKAPAKLIAVVVLPTPPLLFVMARIRGVCGIASRGMMHSLSHGYASAFWSIIAHLPARGRAKITRGVRPRASGGKRKGRCRKGVDLMLDCDPKVVAIDEETNHQIVHRRRLGKVNRAAHKPFNPCPSSDMLAFNFLRLLFAHFVFLWVDMPLVGPPPIGIKPRHPKRLQQRLPLQKDGILPSPKDVGQHGATVVINGMPSPPRFCFLAHVTPHLIEIQCRPFLLGELFHATNVHFDLLGMQGVQHGPIHLLEMRFLF